MSGYDFWIDLLYVLTIVMAIVCMLANQRVNSVYRKYDKVKSARGYTGAQVALEILRRNGITDVMVMHVNGKLTDHYDPRTKTVNLSDSTYGSNSVAAVAVAAHECGHVLQHHTAYRPLQIRTTIVPAAQFGSKLGIPLTVLGMVMSFSPFINIGIWIFSLAVIFQLVTLPVEFNASHRAMCMLTEYGILADEEAADSRKVLTAAAMTYVASAATAVIQLLKLILQNSRRRN